jgi:hypothetical protein
MVSRPSAEDLLKVVVLETQANSASADIFFYQLVDAQSLHALKVIDHDGLHQLLGVVSMGITNS